MDRLEDRRGPVSTAVTSGFTVKPDVRSQESQVATWSHGDLSQHLHFSFQENSVLGPGGPSFL